MYEQKCLLWGPMYANRAYFGLFGAPGNKVHADHRGFPEQTDSAPPLENRIGLNTTTQLLQNNMKVEKGPFEDYYPLYGALY